MDNFTWDNDTSGGNNTEPDEDNFVHMYHFAVNGVAQGLVGIAGLIGKLIKTKSLTPARTYLISGLKS